MKFINRDRGTGKTEMMIYISYATGYPIIVQTNQQKDCIRTQAKYMNCEDIDVYTVDEWKRLKNNNTEVKVLVDEVEDLLKKILNEYLGANVVAATLSLPMN